MKLGIIITTFERPEYLKQCLESINNADIKNDVLFFIVDDCSTDINVFNLINNFSKNHFVIFDLKKQHGAKRSAGQINPNYWPLLKIFL